MATYSRSNHFGPYFQASFHNPPNTRTTALRGHSLSIGLWSPFPFSFALTS